MIPTSAGVGMICILLLGWGCSAGLNLQDVKLQTDRTTYAVGDSASMVLTNQGPAPIGPTGQLLCRPKVERRAGEAWQVVTEFDDVCTLPIDPNLQAGGRVNRKFQITPDRFTSEGQYRLIVNVLVVGAADPMTVASNAFTVTN